MALGGERPATCPADVKPLVFTPTTLRLLTGFTLKDIL